VGNSHIHFTRSIDNGRTWSEQQLTTTNTNLYPDIGFSDAGIAILVWQQRVLLYFSIVYATSSDLGVTWTSAAYMVTSTTDSTLPAIASSGAGKFVTVWVAQNGGGIPCSPTGSGTDIWYSVTKNSGSNWSSPMTLIQNQSSTNSIVNSAPRIATSDDPAWVVVYTTASDTIINYVVSADDTASWTLPLPLDSGQTGADTNTAPDIAATPSGRWTVVWQTNRAKVGNITIVMNPPNAADIDLLSVTCSACYSASIGQVNQKCPVGPTTTASSSSLSSTSSTSGTTNGISSSTGASATTSGNPLSSSTSSDASRSLLSGFILLSLCFFLLGNQ